MKCPDCGNPLDYDEYGYRNCMMCSFHDWQPRLPKIIASEVSCQSGPIPEYCNVSGALAILSGMPYDTFKHKVRQGLFRVDDRDGHNKLLFSVEAMKLNAIYWRQGAGNRHIVYFDKDKQQIVELVDTFVCAEIWPVDRRQSINRVLSGGLPHEVVAGKIFVDRQVVES